MASITLRGSDLAALLRRNGVSTKAAAVHIGVGARHLRNILRLEHPSPRDVERVLLAAATLSRRSVEPDEVSA